jgi:hypothetical protein
MKTNEEEYFKFLNEHRKAVENHTLTREERITYRILLLAWLANNSNKRMEV